MDTQPLYKALASLIDARQNCHDSGNKEMCLRHLENIGYLSKKYLPSGAGIDNGCWIDLDLCSHKKIVIVSNFHHMNSDGYYCGWTYHKVIVTPSFDGFDLSITGRNYNDIKDYLSQVFYEALQQEVTITE